jgi:hypothetical protein
MAARAPITRNVHRIPPGATRTIGRCAGLVVKIVSGETIRNDIHMDFTQGGNEGVYAYVPRGEIWIDDAMGPLDRTATVLHEMVERDQMLRRGLSYERAHDIALDYEKDFRVELKKQRPKATDLRAVGDAYRAYLKITKARGE